MPVLNRCLYVCLALGFYQAYLVPFSVAQDPNALVVEGHVFDKDGKPMRDAYVSIVETNNLGDENGASAPSDSNGFFSIQKIQFDLNPTQYRVIAICRTKRKRVESSLPLYLPIRTSQIYQRDFYLSLPTGTTRCLGGPGN